MEPMKKILTPSRNCSSNYAKYVIYCTYFVESNYLFVIRSNF